MSLSQIQIGGLLAFTAFFVFSLADTMSRHLIDVGHSLPFVVFAFQAIGLGLLLCNHKRLGGIASIAASPYKKTHAVRAVFLAVSIPMNMYAFSVLPFTLVYSLLFTGAFWGILFAWLFHHDPITPRKLIAVIVGMTGAMIVLRPWQAGFDWAIILPLLSAAMYGFRSLLDRRIGATETPLALAVYPMFLVIISMGIAMVIKGGIIVPNTLDLIFLIAGGLCAGIGMLCLPLSFRYATITTVGPLHYTQLVWGGVIGYFFFNQTPDVMTIIGGLIIVAGGAMVLLQRSKT